MELADKLMKNTKKQLVEMVLNLQESELTKKLVSVEVERDELKNKVQELEYSYKNAINDCRGTHKRNDELIEEIDELATKLVVLKEKYRNIVITACCVGGLAIIGLVMAILS